MSTRTKAGAIALAAVAFTAAPAASATSLPITINPAAVLGAAATSGPLAITGLSFSNEAFAIFTGTPPVLDFSIAGFLPVTGFTGAADPKLNVAGGYGLYFQFTGTGTQNVVPVMVNGQTVLPAAYTSLSYRLYGFVEPSSGVSSFLPDGQTINMPSSNTTLLATGTLDAARSTASIVNGTATADLFTVPSAVASTFFGSPIGSTELEFSLNNPPGSTVMNGNVLTINGGAGTAVFVPEPASLALLELGALGVIALRRRLS